MRGGSFFTLLESNVLTSVRVNGLFFPVTSLSQFIINYAEPLVFYNDGFPEFPVSRVGSAARLKLGVRNFLFCTDHQMKTYDMTQVCLVNRSNGNAVTSHGCVYSKLDLSGEPEIDLRLFEFTEAVEVDSLQSSPWYDLSGQSDFDLEKVELTIAAGYPHLGGSIDYDRRDIPVRPHLVYGKYCGKTIGSLHGFDVDPGLDYDPDGMSGGPVFHLLDAKIGFDLVFAGIVSNAGRKRFNFIQASNVLEFIAQS